MSEELIVSLPTNLKIDTVEEVRAELGAALDAESAVTLDGSAVTGIDYSGVQLLLVFVKAMSESELSVSWLKPSDTLMSALTDLNASAYAGTS